MSEDRKTIQVVKAVYANDLPEYYTVQVWTKNEMSFGMTGKTWRTFGLQSKTLEGLRDVLAEAMEFHAKVRVVKTVNEILEIPDVESGV